MNGADPSTSPLTADDSETRPPALGPLALFALFLRFGLLAFGGPVAQIAMIRRELVEEARWISAPHFNRLLAVMQVLPGPEAHELCVHLGIRAGGRLGGLLAGLGFMLPGFLLMLGLAHLYTRLSIDGSWLGALFLGVQAAILAVILRAVHRIGQHILLDRWLWLAAALAAAATLFGASFWVVLPVAGLSIALKVAGRPMLAIAALGLGAAAAAWSVGLPALTPTLAGAATEPTLAALFLAGLKGGLLTFGGAYTAIPFVRRDTVDRGWMSDSQFLDGLGLGSVLPAPLVIFVTFVGYVIAELPGAIAITAGMFLPAFAFSMIFYERLEAVAENVRLQAFLGGVAAAVVGVIAVTWLQLAVAASERTPQPLASALIFAAALAIVWLWKSKLAIPIALGVGGAAGIGLRQFGFA
jgi:chromate transporter